MSCEYVRDHYGVPAEIGRRVVVNGNPGIIVEYRGHYIGVNFDCDKPNVVKNAHPTWKVEYLGIGTIRRMTRSQARWQRYQHLRDIYDNFRQFLKDEKRNGEELTMNHYRITPEDWLLMEKIAKEARCVLQWWADFVSNLERQGWISDKQRMKLKAFNYEHEMNRAYGCGGRRKSKHWAAGLDHDTTSEYTGEPCAAEFSSLTLGISFRAERDKLDALVGHPHQEKTRWNAKNTR